MRPGIAAWSARQQEGGARRHSRTSTPGEAAMPCALHVRLARLAGMAAGHSPAAWPSLPPARRGGARASAADPACPAGPGLRRAAGIAVAVHAAGPLRAGLCQGCRIGFAAGACMCMRGRGRTRGRAAAWPRIPVRQSAVVSSGAALVPWGAFRGARPSGLPSRCPMPGRPSEPCNGRGRRFARVQWLQRRGLAAGPVACGSMPCGQAYGPSSRSLMTGRSGTGPSMGGMQHASATAPPTQGLPAWGGAVPALARPSAADAGVTGGVVLAGLGWSGACWRRPSGRARAAGRRRRPPAARAGRRRSCTRRRRYRCRCAC